MKFKFTSTTFKILGALITVLLVFSFLPMHIASANFSNGGFENGDFTGWTNPLISMTKV